MSKVTIEYKHQEIVNEQSGETSHRVFTPEFYHLQGMGKTFDIAVEKFKEEVRDYFSRRPREITRYEHRTFWDVKL